MGPLNKFGAAKHLKQYGRFDIVKPVSLFGFRSG
jgi:hypothetical protein